MTQVVGAEAGERDAEPVGACVGWPGLIGSFLV